MNGIAAYSRTRIESAPNEQLLVMLLEKAMQKEAEAIAAIVAKDRMRWNAAIHHARAIFIELNNALDHGDAPEVTQTVATTYRWCIFQLGAAARTGDMALLARVREVMDSNSQRRNC